MIPLLIPPGVASGPTKNTPSGAWSEVHMMRWADGRLCPMGGIEKLSGVTFASPCRAVHTWTTTAGVEWTAFLCERHAYVLDVAGVLSDISPTVPLVSPTTLGTGGWGRGKWGKGTWGTPRTGIDIKKALPDAYSLDNWGEDLLVQTSADQRLLRWSPATPSTVLTAVSGAPAGRQFVVTPERFVMMFGIASDPRAFGWCDQEVITDWNFASTTNKAGSYTVEPASPLVAAISTRDGVLLWTSKKLYLSRFVGLPAVYSLEEISDGTVPFSPGSVVTSGGAVLWASEGGFWRFDGGGVAPLACPIWAWIAEDIDIGAARERAVMCRVDTRGEVWWFFPQMGQTENTRAAVYSVREGWWSQARIGRSAGTGDSFTAYPTFARGTEAFRHEQAGGFAGEELPWAETFPLALNDGADMMTILRMLPDVEGDASSLDFTLFSRTDRALKGAERGQTRRVRSNGWVDFRATGRDFRLRIATTTAPVPMFTLGQSLLEVTKRGKR